ncbi:unnamed protein product [Caenorhabditis brenneri]
MIKKYSKVNYVKSTKHVIHLEPSDKLTWYGDKFDATDVTKFWTQDSTLSELLPMLDSFNGMFSEQALVLKNNLDLLDELKALNFDVMIFESFVLPAYYVLDYLQIKAFIPCTSITFEDNILHSIGEPLMPSSVSGPVSQFSDKMSLKERIINVITPFIFILLTPKREFKSLRPPHNLVDVATQESLCSFVFTNSNPYIDFPRPTLEKNVQIGGISVDVEEVKKQKLNGKWDDILNLRTQTVLLSFGCRKTLARTMGKLADVTFIWKYESDDMDNFAKGIKNIHFFEWVPQSSLLADPRLSAFFTHAGLGSINEVSYFGKPAILV